MVGSWLLEWDHFPVEGPHWICNGAFNVFQGEGLFLKLFIVSTIDSLQNCTRAFRPQPSLILLSSGIILAIYIYCTNSGVTSTTICAYWARSLLGLSDLIKILSSINRRQWSSLGTLEIHCHVKTGSDLMLIRNLVIRCILLKLIVIHQMVWFVDLHVQMVLNLLGTADLLFWRRKQWTRNRGLGCGFSSWSRLCLFNWRSFVFSIHLRYHSLVFWNRHNVNQSTVHKHQIRLWPGLSGVLTPSQRLPYCMHQRRRVLVIFLDRSPDRLPILRLKRRPDCDRHSS